MVLRSPLNSTITTCEVTSTLQSVASVVDLVHAAVAGFIIASVGWLSRVGASVCGALVQLVELFDVTLGESGSSTNDVLVIAILRHHGYFSVTESGFVVVHDGSVVVGVSEGVDFSGFVEVVDHILLDVVFVDSEVIIAIWTTLFMVES